MALKVRGLFGGAIDLKLPENYLDASELRQVPDTQEVFLAPNSGNSIILEILQSVPPSDPKEVAQYIFDSLANDNEASFSDLSEVSVPAVSIIEGRSGHIVACGTQRVRKFNKTHEDEVLILLGIHRVPSRGVDLVVTENVPLPRDAFSRPNTDETEKIKETFHEIVKSLSITDYALFA